MEKVYRVSGRSALAKWLVSRVDMAVATLGVSLHANCDTNLLADFRNDYMRLPI